MEAARWERVKDVFSAAVELKAGERAAFLDQECGSDADLRTEVESLLQAHEQTDDFIERPAAQQALGLNFDPPAAATWIGRRVGAYRIVAEIGRGGMSEVFRGIRADDEYDKDVAIKVLLPGYATRLLVERFKAEKQMLASLDHPNIARILDGGTTDEGLPYLVMDFIKGRPIDEYAVEQHLSVEQKLELFQTLCSAVQYVHQHLMVHGDLKGSNVLVTDEGSVRLLDFGVARLIHAKPSPHPADSHAAGPIAMTPEYASPEQLQGGVVSTASDVYSLGVMLYRLLTGRLPYASSDGLPHELANQLADRHTVPPSEAVRQSRSAALGLRQQLEGDLDSVVMMALHKDPAGRYSSVERLSEDIRRYQQGFPVIAHPPSVTHKVVKFCGRHRAGIAAFGLFTLALIAGIVATGWEAHIARQERARAERHFDDVRRLANTFMFDVHEAIQNLPGATPARHMLVLNSLKYLDALAAESADDPTLQRELATAYEKVADVQGGYREANLGDSSGAIESYRKALAIRTALLPTRASDLDLHRDLLRNYGKLGEVLSASGDTPGAIESSRHALEFAEELARSPGSNAGDRRNLGSVYVSLGWQIAKANEVERGLLLMNQGTAVFETLVDADPKDTRSSHHAAVAYGRMGELLIGANRYADALKMHTRQAQIAHALSLEDPTNADLQTIEAYAWLGIATVLFKQGATTEALARQMLAVNSLRALFEADAKNTEARYNAAFALSEASETLITIGQFPLAERNLRDALKILEPLFDADEPARTNARLQKINAHHGGQLADLPR